ncbi:hypothetical protein ANCDUO_05220 [Ancylostoma duodenale]|uniref:Uncharacterized protein n=1 Tax=Ancylostoma duodenale TaxID=51022 RepID=A0A0C2GT76_9BILA|nr:hypothetical protein ANCDUO_05220 [Ancylostoma duodenale]
MLSSRLTSQCTPARQPKPGFQRIERTSWIGQHAAWTEHNRKFVEDPGTKSLLPSSSAINELRTATIDAWEDVEIDCPKNLANQMVFVREETITIELHTGKKEKKTVDKITSAGVLVVRLYRRKGYTTAGSCMNTARQSV